MSAAVSTLPAPPSAKPIPIAKRCGCGRTYTEAQWDRLPYVGRMPLTDQTDCLIRNCSCGSSIAVEVECLTDKELRVNGMLQLIEDRRRRMSSDIAEALEHIELVRWYLAMRRNTDANEHLQAAAQCAASALRCARDTDRLQSQLRGAL